MEAASQYAKETDKEVSLDNPSSIPSGFWFDFHKRGGRDLLVIMKGSDAKGSFEVDTYQEKVAWMKALEVVNSTLAPSSSG